MKNVRRNRTGKAVAYGIVMNLLLQPLLAPRSMANEDTSYTTFLLISAASEWTKELTSPFEAKPIPPQAREDAAAFIASEGEIRGPFLEKTIIEIRKSTSTPLSDLDIASLVLISKNPQ